ncbi:MAG: hypothetical protein NTZ73_01335 [Candidatus Diapherotrites archaeon]|nr:hypothetical protein [Candidatus Diapherotrites archaeon]
MISEKLAGFYTRVEDKYFDFLDFLDAKGMPVYKYSDFFENKGIPSFIVTVAILVLLITLISVGLAMSVPATQQIVLMLRDAEGNPLQGVSVTVLNMSGETIAGPLEKNDGDTIEIPKLPQGTKVKLIASKDGYQIGDAEIALGTEIATGTLSLEPAFEGINAILNLVDAENGTNITGATAMATWNEMLFNFDTDNNGNYIKSGMPEGKTVTLTAEADGYDGLSTTTTFYDKSPRIFKMTPSSQGYDQKSNVIVTVKDSAGNTIDGAKVTLINKANEVILLEDYTKQGSVAGAIQTGIVLKIIVEKDGYLQYDSESEAKLITLREKERQIDVVLKQGGEKLNVLVTNKLGLALENTSVQLYDIQGNLIDAGKTTVSGIEFGGLDSNEMLIVTAHHEGYLAQRKKVNVASTEEVTFALEPVTGNNSAALDIFAVDEFAQVVNGANVAIYINEDGNMLPYGYSELVTPITGYVRATVESGKIYEVRAETAVLQGETSAQVPGKTPVKAYVIMKKKAQILEMIFEGPKGEKIYGTAEVNTIEGEPLYDGNISNSKIFFDAEGKEVVEVIVYLSDGNMFSENVNVKGKDTVTVVVYGGTVDALAPKIEFVGLEDEAGNEIGGITPGAFYWAKFSVTFPLGAEKGGVHFRIGNDAVKFAESGNGAIFELGMQGANTFYSTSYSPTPAPGNETIDRANAGDVGNANKWVEGTLGQPNGTYIAKVKIRVSDYTAGTIDLKYRAWGINQTSYYRNPEDISLGNNAFTDAKSGLYAEARVQQLKLYESLPECSGNICLALNFLDGDGKFYDTTAFQPIKGNVYALEAEVSVQEGETVEMTVSSPEKIKFTSVQKVAAGSSTGFSGSETGGTTSGFGGGNGTTTYGTGTGDSNTGISTGLVDRATASGVPEVFSQKKSKLSFAATDTNYFPTTLGSSSDIQGMVPRGAGTTGGLAGTKEMTTRVTIGPGGKQRIRFYFVGDDLGAAQINFKAVGSTQIEKAISFNIVAQKELLVELSKDQVNLGEAFTVRVRDTNSGPIENALVKIVDKKGEAIKSISGTGKIDEGKSGNYKVANNFDAGLYTVQVSAPTYPTKEVPLLITTKNILDFPDTIEVKMPFNQTQSVVSPQPQLLNNSEFQLLNITYELNGNDKNKDNEINNFKFTIGLPPALGKNGKIMVPITVSYTGNVSDSADETATLTIKAMIEGKFLTQISSKVHVSYNKKMDEACLKIEPSSVTINLIGTAESTDSETVEVTNGCEQTLMMKKRVKENTTKSYIIVDSEELSLEVGETKNVTVTARNLIDRKFQRDNSFSYEIIWDANYLTKRLPVTVKTINPSMALSYPGQITLWLAQNSQNAKATAMQPIFVTNISNFPVEGITFSAQRDYGSGTNVSLSIEPPGTITLEKGQSAAKNAFAQAASVITEPVRASILIRGRMGNLDNRSGQRDGYGYYENYYNDYYNQYENSSGTTLTNNINTYAPATNVYTTGMEDLGVIDVMIYYSGFNCFKVSPIDDMTFNISSAGAQIAKRVAIQNDCAEPVTVTGVVAKTPEVILSIYPQVTVGVKQRVEAMITVTPRTALGRFADAIDESKLNNPNAIFFAEDPCKDVLCDDGNPCTEDTCSNGNCSHTKKADGTSCGEGKTCKNGSCVTATPVAPTTTPPVTTPTTTPSTTKPSSASISPASTRIPNYPIVIVGITSISQTPLESKPITISVYSDQDGAGQFSKVNKGVKISVCGKTEKESVDFPKTGSNCAENYCDGKTAAKYLGQKLNTMIKNAESAGYSKQNLTENFGCENQGYCTFGALGIKKETIPLYLQNDKISDESLSESLQEQSSGQTTGFRGITGIGNYLIEPFEVTNETISMIAQAGSYPRRIFLDNALKGCGFYRISIDGAFPVSGGQIMFTEPVIVIKAEDFGSGKRIDTKECTSNIINISNFNPVDEGYTAGDSKGTMLATVGGGSKLDEIAKRVAKERYKDETRNSSTGPGARVEIKEGPVEEALAQVCMGTGGDAKTINVTVSTDIAKLAKSKGTDSANAYVQVAKMVSDTLGGNFGETNCVTKGATGYECVKLTDPSGLGTLKMNIPEKTMNLSQTEGCVLGKVVSGVVESVEFEIEQGKEFKGITKITIRDSANKTVYKEVTYDGTVLKDEKPGVPMVLEYGNKKDEPYSKEISICATAGSDKTPEGSPGYLEAKGSSFVVTAINKNAGGDRHTNAEDGTVTIGIATLHIDDLADKLYNQKDTFKNKGMDHPYYFTIQWMGDPEVLNFKDYLEGLAALKQMPTAVIKSMDQGYGLTEAGDALVKAGKKSAINQYLMGCAGTTIACDAYTGPFNTLIGLLTNCGIPAGTMFKQDLVENYEFFRGGYNWLSKNLPFGGSIFDLSPKMDRTQPSWSPIKSPAIGVGVASAGAARALKVASRMSGGLNPGLINSMSDLLSSQYREGAQKLLTGSGLSAADEKAILDGYAAELKSSLKTQLTADYTAARNAGRGKVTGLMSDFGVAKDAEAKLTTALGSANEAANKKFASLLKQKIGSANTVDELLAKFSNVEAKSVKDVIELAGKSNLETLVKMGGDFDARAEMLSSWSATADVYAPADRWNPVPALVTSRVSNDAIKREIESMVDEILDKTTLSAADKLTKRGNMLSQLIGGGTPAEVETFRSTITSANNAKSIIGRTFRNNLGTIKGTLELTEGQVDNMLNTAAKTASKNAGTAADTIAASKKLSNVLKSSLKGLARGIGCGIAANAVGIYMYNRSLGVTGSSMAKESLETKDFLFIRGHTYKMIIEPGEDNKGTLTKFEEVTGDKFNQMLLDLRPDSKNEKKGTILTSTPTKDGRYPEQRPPKLYLITRNPVQMKQELVNAGYNNEEINTKLSRIVRPEIQNLIFRYTAENDLRKNPNKQRVIVGSQPANEALAITIIEAGWSEYTEEKRNEELKNGDGWLKNKLTIALGEMPNTGGKITKELGRKVFPNKDDKFYELFEKDGTAFGNVGVWNGHLGN